MPARLPVRPPRSRALALASSSELCALCVSALSFSSPSLFPVRLPAFNFKLSTFNFLFRQPPRIAPSPQPEYSLPSPGGLGCESVRQARGSSLESSLQQFSALRPPRTSSIKNSIPKCPVPASCRPPPPPPFPPHPCP